MRRGRGGAGSGTCTPARAPRTRSSWRRRRCCTGTSRCSRTSAPRPSAAPSSADRGGLWKRALAAQTKTRIWKTSWHAKRIVFVQLGPLRMALAIVVFPIRSTRRIAWRRWRRRCRLTRMPRCLRSDRVGDACWSAQNFTTERAHFCACTFCGAGPTLLIFSLVGCAMTICHQSFPNRRFVSLTVAPQILARNHLLTRFAAG